MYKGSLEELATQAATGLNSAAEVARSAQVNVDVAAETYVKTLRRAMASGILINAIAEGHDLERLKWHDYYFTSEASRLLTPQGLDPDFDDWIWVCADEAHRLEGVSAEVVTVKDRGSKHPENPRDLSRAEAIFISFRAALEGSTDEFQFRGVLGDLASWEPLQPEIQTSQAVA